MISDPSGKEDRDPERPPDRVGAERRPIAAGAVFERQRLEAVQGLQHEEAQDPDEDEPPQRLRPHPGGAVRERGDGNCHDAVRASSRTGPASMRSPDDS